MINSTMPTKSVNAAMSTSSLTNGNDILRQSGRNDVHHAYRNQPLLVPSSAEACKDVSQELLQKERHARRVYEARDVVKRIGGAEEAFEIVLKKLSDLLNESGYDREQVNNYCNEWRKLSEDFDSIALGTSKMAAQGATIIKDFSNTSSQLLRDDKVTIQQKQERLAKLKETLLGEDTREKFEIGEGTMYGLAQKISCHQRDVLGFEFSMQLHGISGKPELSDDIKVLEAKIKKLQKEVTKMENEHANQAQMVGAMSVLTVLDIKHAPHSGKVGATGHVLRQDERRRKLTQSIQEHKTNLKQKIDTEDSRHKKVWEDHLHTCEEQIASISDHLSAVSIVWTALCSDTAELNAELESVAGKGLHEDLFRRRLGTTIEMYTRLHEVLSELARRQSPRPGAGGQAQKGVAPTKKSSTQKKSLWRIPVSS